MKTKLEIINETASFYNLGNRSLLFENGEPVMQSNGEHQRCVYNGPDGKQCAFARCCGPILEEYESKSAHTILREGGGVEILKPEYRINDRMFWRSIQILHDNGTYWTETGLSESGEKYAQSLRERYATE